jgi:hypothetical protein
LQRVLEPKFRDFERAVPEGERKCVEIGVSA